VRTRVLVALSGAALLLACVGGSRINSGSGGGAGAGGSGGAGGGGGRAGSGGATSATGGAGGVGAGGAAGAGGRGGAAGGGVQNPTGLCPADTATCTTAEWNAYTSCVADACDSQYQVCLGASYRAGTFAGPCGPWAQCLSACGCGNAGCRAGCPAQTAACATCYANVSSCLVSCTIPPCALATADAGAARDAATTGDAAAGAGCAALMACCNAIADATNKDDCLSTYATIATYGDRACGQVLDEYHAIGYCQ